MSYKVVRHFADPKLGRKVIETGLTLEEAQEHCKDPETSSRTCKSSKMKAYTVLHGEWFDGYDEE